MLLTSTSSSNDDLLVEVRNLYLEYRLSRHYSASLRDSFIQTFSGKGRSIERLRVIQNVSFDVRRGDRIGILGVNGAGKSSLCRTLAGLLNPNSGFVKRYGEVRGIFDIAVGFYPELTGRENARVLLNLLYPKHWRQHDALLGEALEFSELGSFLDAPYRTYSTGMQARLCLSLVSRLPSDVLILDEVFDGADTFFKKKISERIIDLMQSSGAVILISHSLEQIAKVCNRILVLEKGQICFDGDVFDGISRYLGTQPVEVEPILEESYESFAEPHVE